MRNALNRENCLVEIMLDNVHQYDLSSYNLEDYNFGTPSRGIVRQNEEYRADLLSHRIYGTTDLGWFLMWYNGFMDEQHDLKAGTAFQFVPGERVREAIRYVKDRVNKIGG